MTGLEALEESINDYHKSVIQYYYTSNISKEKRNELFDKYKDEFEVIKKELGALEILKHKQIKLSLIKEPTINSYDIYNFYLSEKDMLLTKEKFDLLKEVFK